MIYFQVATPLGFRVRTTKSYWGEVILDKHPTLSGKERLVENALFNPDEIRQSIRDEKVLLFYKKFNNVYLCVVVKWLNSEGFVITAYHTAKIKKGDIIWQKGE